jgi:hypothetical protein
MNFDPSEMQGPTGGGAPSEDELRAAYEAELVRISATDMIAQSAVSLLNIGAHRMGAPTAEGEPAAGQDLEQARDAIDATRALLEILERRIPGELAPLRDALSRLQMAYATESGRSQAPGPGPGGSDSGEPAAAAAGAPEQPGTAAEETGPDQSGPGPAESSGRLWVPGR